VQTQTWQPWLPAANNWRHRPAQTNAHPSHHVLAKNHRWPSTRSAHHPQGATTREGENAWHSSTSSTDGAGAVWHGARQTSGPGHWPRCATGDNHNTCVAAPPGSIKPTLQSPHTKAQTAPVLDRTAKA
jgi:hypothetical protein